MHLSFGEKACKMLLEAICKQQHLDTNEEARGNVSFLLPLSLEAELQAEVKNVQLFY